MNSTSSLESTSHSNSSKFSIPKTKFSANKMLSKAKDTTKSLVHEVLEKRHSLDSKRSSNEETTIPHNTSAISNRDSIHSSSTNNETHHHHHPFKAIKKRLSIAKRNNNTTMNRTLKSSKSQDSLSSMTDATSASSSLSSTSSLHADIQSDNNNNHQSTVAAVVAAAAEADILSGVERPGSFALACDFHLANEKQNEEFHALFKSVPDSDKLIEYYKCALQKDILLQGHLYVSEHHVCFKSNIFGWVTNLVINFSEIIRVEKRMTAKIIPNGILIATNTSTHIFASFLLRDQAYDQIVKIWDLSKRANSARQSDSTRGSFDETDEDDDDEDSINSTSPLNSPPVLITDHHDPIIIQQQQGDTMIPSNNITATSNNEIPANNNSNNTVLVPILNKSTTKQRPRSISDSFPKSNLLSFEPILSSIISKPEEDQSISNANPTTTNTALLLKKPKVCPCVLKGERHHHIALNETYQGTVDAMTKLLFHSSFYKSFLEKYENFEDVELGAWKHGSRQVTGKRKIKSSTTGTRMINILFQEKKEHRKMPYYNCVSTKKSMPDMPMGAVYSIQSRTCITRVNKEKVHVIISFEVVFSKSGLVSSIIEKNAADDQFRLHSHLSSVLKKPELIRTLVDDRALLQELRIIEPDKNKAVSKSWKGLTMTECIYIGFFFVLVTHCILALRLQHITHHLEWVKHQTQPPADVKQDQEWVSNKINLAHQRLDLLKSEIKGYDERIARLRNQQANLSQ